MMGLSGLKGHPVSNIHLEILRVANKYNDIKSVQYSCVSFKIAILCALQIVCMLFFTLRKR